MTATMLLTLPSFHPDQRVAVVSERLRVGCPTFGNHDRHDCDDFARVPFTSGCIAIAVPCDTCGGSGRHCNAGWGGHPGPCPYICPGRCNGLGYLVVASADVTAVVPIVFAVPVGQQLPYVHLYGDGVVGLASEADELCDWWIDAQREFVEFRNGAWAVLLDNVATVEERCPRCDGEVGDGWSFPGLDAPIPVAGGDTFRKWEL